MFVSKTSVHISFHLLLSVTLSQEQWHKLKASMAKYDISGGDA